MSRREAGMNPATVCILSLDARGYRRGKEIGGDEPRHYVFSPARLLINVSYYGV